MKTLSLNLVALVAMALPAFAGEVCLPDPVCSSKKTGYIFAYGGVTFGYDIDADLDIPPILGQLLLGQSSIGLDGELDEGFIIGGGVGIHSCFAGGTRFEFEGLHSSSDFDRGSASVGGATFGAALDGDMEINAFMANIVKEFPRDGFTPYIGAGLGFASVEWNLEAFGFGLQADDTTLAYQFKAGVDVPVSDCFTIFGEYKLLGITDTDYSIILPISGDGFVTHNVVVGARLGF